jgi:uncharacterized protein YchJ
MLVWSPLHLLKYYYKLSQILQCQLWALFFFSQKGNHEKEKKECIEYYYLWRKQARNKERKKLSKFSKGTKAWLYMVLETNPKSKERNSPSSQKEQKHGFMVLETNPKNKEINPPSFFLFKSKR